MQNAKVQNARVYVIDDDPAMRDSLDFLLGSAGLHVRLFESAQMFLNELPSLEAGCVVTDIRMPGIDGMELLRRTRSCFRRAQAARNRDDRPWRRSVGGRSHEARRA